MVNSAPTVVAPGTQLMPFWACAGSVVCGPYPSIIMHLFLVDNTRRIIKVNLVVLTDIWGELEMVVVKLSQLSALPRRKIQLCHSAIVTKFLSSAFVLAF